jgi:hypothetical protein
MQRISRSDNNPSRRELRQNLTQLKPLNKKNQKQTHKYFYLITGNNGTDKTETLAQMLIIAQIQISTHFQKRVGQ